MDVSVGDILTLKKQHPCGSNEWIVLRVGADFKLRCQGCGHEIMSTRRNIEKHIKKIVKSADISKNFN